MWFPVIGFMMVFLSGIFGPVSVFFDWGPDWGMSLYFLISGLWLLDMDR
jgi:hypothetical protein